MEYSFSVHDSRFRTLLYMLFRCFRLPLIIPGRAPGPSDADPGGAERGRRRRPAAVAGDHVAARGCRDLLTAL